MSTFSDLDRVAAAALPGLSPAAGRFRNIVVLAGTCVLIFSGIYWNSPDLIKYITFLTVALVVSAGRAISPSGAISISPALILVLFGISELTMPETVTLAALVTLLPAIWRHFRAGESWQHLGFEVALAATGTGFAVRVFESSYLVGAGLNPVLRLTIATLALFLVETTPRIALFAFDRSRSLAALWITEMAWAVPYYFGGALLAFGMATISQTVGWQTVVATGPAMYLIYRAYRLYLHRVEDQRKHAEDMAALHLRTIEALALAIEAKDHTTHDHLQRVHVYAREIAKDLGLTAIEQEALMAAALLHDIGKLAVPEHIISKPGRLTPEEFEKMKIHPIVGAEILERVRFPYPVAPIVRTHHEKWDGTGYPAGVKGEDIPIGARILSAVDCLDALASDRQYRRALPLDEAMKVVQSESGKAFDPRVVDCLSRRYVELERMAQGSTPPKVGKLSTDVKVELGEAPAAGFEKAESSSAEGKTPPMDFLNSIASARAEVQTLFEISQDLGNSLSLDETLSVLSVKLRRIIPHHSLAIWLRSGDKLNPAYVNGEDYRLFSSLEIPVGQGLSGWVAENGKPIVNGNPTVESGYLNDPTVTSTLRSAVAVPLDGNNGNVGVLALYHSDRDAFTRDHLRIMNAINTKIGMAIENALRFRQAESTATTDYMTQLPNARSLFLQLDSELARAKRGDKPLTVVVLDMNGLKTINDRFGHLEGNRILSQVATGLKSACREYDYVARMGGDEFVVLIPGMRAADTQSRIDHLRQVVANAGHGLFPDKQLTASIGIASFPEDGSAAEQILAEADRRMYQEKQQSKEARSTAPSHDWAMQLAALQTDKGGYRDFYEAPSQKPVDIFASSSL
jgi:diguanylate cyclase (GGDEF)-like protein/putative nucleotidyltransferase with HDIG domain